MYVNEMAITNDERYKYTSSHVIQSFLCMNALEKTYFDYVSLIKT